MATHRRVIFLLSTPVIQRVRPSARGLALREEGVCIQACTRKPPDPGPACAHTRGRGSSPLAAPSLHGAPKCAARAARVPEGGRVEGRRHFGTIL